MKTEFSDALIEAVVVFWTRTLSSDTDEAATPQDDDAMFRLATQVLKVASGVAAIRGRLKPSEEKRMVFSEKLRELLREPFKEGAPRVYGVQSPDWIELGTDYNAQGILLEAAKAAGVSDMAFPFKTRMVIRGRRVTVGHDTIFEERT